ncbi:hypothetical protein BN1079_03402 [Pseudomonas saudiphocaensis]|uniref:Uncharacterized protein n=1 Tax=Pseudomonas saudiphocaensis TaxID=1499686 RepID=A0A078M070_9PSED|nr:hypothetical protein BN1079_03402 [Pseudomonas saudiphocaensis]
MRLSKFASLPKRRWGQRTAYAITVLGLIVLIAAQALEQPRAPGQGASLNAHSMPLPFGSSIPWDAFR